ncbi:MAG: hypothetical protein J6M14_01600 [Campylobacter sp.]|nr:hypothetical protein [Campylobacter sp.]
MICPVCAYEHSKVIKTIKGLKNLRVRQCKTCGYVWNTLEQPIKDEKLIKYCEYLEEIGEFEKVKNENF